MQFSFASEAIAYQGKSPFAEAIRKSMQECIDHVNTFTTVKDRLAAYDDLSKMVKSSLPGIIKEHTGIYITDVIIPKSPCMLFAIGMTMWNDATTISIMQRYKGYKLSSFERQMIEAFTESKTLIPEDTQKLVDQLNLATGTYTTIDKFGKTAEDTKAKAFRPTVSGALYFDVYYAFLIRETYHQKLEPLTAEEITAIVLHEVGHLLSLVEHASQRYLVFDMLYQTTLGLVQKVGTDKDARKAIRKLIEVTPTQSKPEQFRKDITIKALNALDELEFSNQEGHGIRTAIFDLISMALRLTLCTVINIIFLPVSVISIMEALLHTSTAIKNSDTVGTLTDMASIERYADQYVTQHGYGSHLATELRKATDADVLIPRTSASALKTSTLAYYALTSIFTVFDTINKRYPMGGSYEPNNKRILRLKQDILQNLIHADTLPREFIRDMLLEYNQLDSIMTSHSRYNRILDGIDAFYTYLGNHLSPGALVAELRNGNLVVEYTKLKNQVQAQIANPLLATAAKLDLLKH
jgi:hypothetical protein